MKLKCVCVECGKEFERHRSNIKNPARTFCSKSCSSKGPNNPSFGKKWSDDKKQRQSEIIKSRVDDEYREKVGSANRGKKFSPERIEKMHGHRSRESYVKFPSEETRKKIGEASKKKFTPEYKERIRKQFEDKGLWIPLDQIDDYELYYKQANWIDGMFNLIKDETSLKLMNEHGIFNSRTNSKGVVRDHMFSRRSGFESGVFPELMRHPANLQILTHSQNIKKKKSRYEDGNSITLETLFERIRTFDGLWKEHDLCIELIERYQNGKRWTREKGG